MFRTARSAGQERRAIVPAKAFQLGIEFRIVPIGLDHGRLQIVEIQGLGDPSQLTEAILQTTDEGLRSRIHEPEPDKLEANPRTSSQQ